MNKYTHILTKIHTDTHAYKHTQIHIHTYIHSSHKKNKKTQKKRTEEQGTASLLACLIDESIKHYQVHLKAISRKTNNPHQVFTA